MSSEIIDWFSLNFLLFNITSIYVEYKLVLNSNSSYFVLNHRTVKISEFRGVFRVI